MVYAHNFFTCHIWFIINFQFKAFKVDHIQQSLQSLVSFVPSLLSSINFCDYSVQALVPKKLAFSLLVFLSFFYYQWIIFTQSSIVALLLILVHSFYSWDKHKKEDHLTASFKQFIKSSHPARIVSAVEQAVKSCNENPSLLCEEIIQIVWKNSLGKFILEFWFSIDLHIADHPALSNNPTKAGKVKKTFSDKIHGLWKHS